MGRAMDRLAGIIFELPTPSWVNSPNSMKLLATVKRFAELARRYSRFPDRHSLMTGRILAETLATKRDIRSLEDVEFQVFSQWGDDGIIQWLLRNIDFPHHTFIEFGVEDYYESNTRFLLMNNNWSGLIMDGSEKHVQRIQAEQYYWRHELTAKAAFIDKDNIDGLVASSGFEREVGILSIDIDGNDYWVLKAIQSIDPVVLIVEYNSVFGVDRAVTVPYNPKFNRTEAHYSNLYFGASLKAFHYLALQRGYAFIGCTSAGNNAYFVKRDRLNDQVREASLEAGYRESKFRESRDRAGATTNLSGASRLGVIRGLPVVNVETGQEEKL